MGSRIIHVTSTLIKAPFTEDDALAYAVDQLEWYSRSMKRARWAHRGTELLVLLAGAVTTLLAALAARPWLTAVVAATTLMLTGVRKAYQWQERWTSSSRAWVELRTLVESYQIEGTEIHGRQAELVERVNAILKSETSSWATSLLSAQERG
jgi:hypothetical protein